MKLSGGWGKVWAGSTRRAGCGGYETERAGGRSVAPCCRPRSMSSEWHCACASGGSSGSPALLGYGCRFSLSSPPSRRDPH